MTPTKIAEVCLLTCGLLIGSVSYADDNGGATSSASGMSSDSSKESAGQYIDDSAITAKVKTVFAKDKIVKATDISVTTNEGIVDLSGNVTSKREAKRAVYLAKRVKGVKSVNNDIQVSD